MTLSADLIAVMSLKVGAAGTAYPCTAFARTVKVSGPDQTSAVAYRHETWTATCHAVAANLAGVAPLWDAIRGHFCQRGERVTLATWTIARVLPESGDPGETPEERSIAGYPIVEITEVGDKSQGTWLTFTVRAEAMIGIVTGDLVEHDYAVSESQSDSGLVTIGQRGRVRVVNEESARAWVDTNVIDVARSAAGTAGHAFTVRYTQGLDAAAIEYEYSAADRSGGGSGISDSSVVDRTQRSNDGRIVRTISGHAKGPSATTYAQAQEPDPEDWEVFTRKDISEPSVPEGRVEFSYELAVGVSDAGFPGIYVFRIQETIAEVGGGRDLVVSEFFNAAPVLRDGIERAYVYVQATTIEFIGADADHGIVPLLDEDLISGRPRLTRPASPIGVNAVSIRYMFVSDTAIDPLPSVTRIDPFA